MSDKLTELFAHRTVSLLGAGVSNMPLAEIAAKTATRLTVRDAKSPTDLGENGERLRALGAELITGEDYLAGIDEDLVFRSPGIRPDLPPLLEAVRRGSTLTSEMELFLACHPCPIYAITGSDGKTTTTTLTSLLLEAGGAEVFLGGNIGAPLLNRLPLIKPTDSVAVELSSFQLMTVDAPIDVAAITNIEPNHLNWHTDMDEYIAAKKNILAHAGRAVLNYDNAVTRAMAQELQATTDIPVTYFSLSPMPTDGLRPCDSAIWLGADGMIRASFPGEGEQEILSRTDIRLPGLHNVANYMTAIAVTWGRVSPAEIRSVATSFGGVAHRLEFVREVGGVTYINGSIDSSPTRTAAALSAIADRPVVLIAGGYDKNIPYAPLADAIYASSVHTVVLTGATAGKIADALTSHAQYGVRPLVILSAPVFDDAIARARDAASPGDTVILSPASASFDAFKNFEARGEHFKTLVRSF